MITIDYEAIPSICYYCAIPCHIANNCIDRFSKDPIGTTPLPYDDYFVSTKNTRFVPPEFIGMNSIQSLDLLGNGFRTTDADQGTGGHNSHS